MIYITRGRVQNHLTNRSSKDISSSPRFIPRMWTVSLEATDDISFFAQQTCSCRSATNQ